MKRIGNMWKRAALAGMLLILSTALLFWLFCGTEAENTADAEADTKDGMSYAASDHGEAIINPTKDQVSIVFDTIENTEKEGGETVITGARFKVENISEDAFSFDDIIMIAYDKELNLLEISSDNEPIELAHGERSTAFKYSINGEAEFIKVVGYQYIENGKTYIDTFEDIALYRGNDNSVIDVDNYSDEEILQKAYE